MRITLNIFNQDLGLAKRGRIGGPCLDGLALPKIHTLPRLSTPKERKTCLIRPPCSTNIEDRRALPGRGGNMGFSEITHWPHQGKHPAPSPCTQNGISFPLLSLGSAVPPALPGPPGKKRKEESYQVSSLKSLAALSNECPALPCTPGMS